jgi:hypothetical protein
MPVDALKERKDALENEFFARENAKALEELREQESAIAAREDLGEETGIYDAPTLDALVAVGITAETLAALSLVPLVAVAWADGKLDAGERKAILQASDELGLGDAQRVLLDGWLERAPGGELLEAWKGYIASLLGELHAEAVAELRTRLVGGARQVAEAAGGLLGLGNKVSASEAALLAELDACFDV